MSLPTEAANPLPSAGSAWALIKDAIRGSESVYTEGPIGRALILLAIPMVLEMVMESIFSLVDIYFVAKLGVNAVAIVGLTESMITVVYVIAMGLGIGATAMISRRIGEGDPEAASHTATQAIALGILMSLVLGILGGIFAPDLLVLMGASAEVIAEGSGFTRLMLGGNIVIVLLFLVNAVFRGAGDAAIAMRVLWLANIINIILCPCFIFGYGPFPELGVTGAAVATTIGRGVGVIYAITRLMRGSGRITIRRRHLHLDLSVMARLIRISSSGMLQIFLGMASWIALVRIVSRFGSAAVAGYTIGIRLILFALLPSLGLSNAAATMVGQGLGAGKPERAERAVWIAAVGNMVFLGAVGLLFILVPEWLIAFFTTDPAVVPYAVDCLRVVACGFLFYAFEMVVTQAFNGAGDTLTPTLINFFAHWVFQIPLAWLLAVTLGMGPHGVFLAITITYASMAVVGALLFRRGKWKQRKV